jgi:HK97 gp10 family phage protein
MRMSASFGNSLAAFERSVQQIERNLDKNVSKAVDDVTQKLLEDAKAGTPVDTGNLRDNWEIKTSDKQGEVTNDLPYASAVEYGTSRQKPKRMLTKALIRAKENLAKEIRQAMKDIDNGKNI